MSSRKANDFLRAMSPETETPAPTPALPAVQAPKQVEPKPAGRVGLKHIGGYFDKETVELVAILRVRLGLDNSELLKLAIEDLHRKHSAKRAYGDA